MTAGIFKPDAELPDDATSIEGTMPGGRGRRGDTFRSEEGERGWGDSLQNPSDPDAGYSGHKGQGYTVQMMETLHAQEEGRQSLRLITYVEVTSAAVTDHHAIEGAMQAVEERGVKPELLLADTLYGSDDNVAKARDHGVELVSPVNSQEGKSGHMPLSAFRVNAEDVIVECPGGQTPQRVKQEKEKVTVWFERKICEGCVHKEACPVLWSKKRIRLPYELKSMRSSRRRQVEDGPEFREKYRWRSGIESAFSEWDRRTGVKHLRVRGRKAVRFCVFLKALGLNILRYTAWVIEGGKELAPDPGKGSSRGLVGFGKDLLLNFHNRNSLLKAFSIRIWLDKIPGCVQVAVFLTRVMGCLFFKTDFLPGRQYW